MSSVFNETVLAVGGGISGMTAAQEAAEYGKQVILVANILRYFPKLWHPTCGLEINLKRMRAQKNLRLLTMTEVAGVDGEAGNYSVTLKITPRYVNENCTACLLLVE